MNLRGKALAEHVARGLATDKTAGAIAAGAQYLHVERCAQNLARAGYAPIARRLLDRHELDLLNAPESDPEAEVYEPKRTGRPPRTTEELLDELTDMSKCGLTFDETAARLGIKPHSLRCAAYAKGLTNEVRALFPDKFRVKFSAGELVARLVELAEAGESYGTAAKIVGYKPESLAKRLYEDGTHATIRAAFPGQKIYRRSREYAA